MGYVTTKTGLTRASAKLTRFTGGEYDPTSGYTKLGVRYYDPTTARFTQPDTIVRLADPRNGDLYAYAGDQPCNNVDPSGRGFGECLVGAFLTLGGSGALEAASLGATAAEAAEGAALTASIAIGTLGFVVLGAGLLFGAAYFASQC